MPNERREVVVEIVGTVLIPDNPKIEVEEVT
jgi:hypothetical protein